MCIITGQVNVGETAELIAAADLIGNDLFRVEIRVAHDNPLPPSQICIHAGRCGSTIAGPDGAAQGRIEGRVKSQTKLGIERGPFPGRIALVQRRFWIGIFRRAVEIPPPVHTGAQAHDQTVIEQVRFILGVKSVVFLISGRILIGCASAE